MGRFKDWLFPPLPTTADMTWQLPTPSGDVAQVANLPSAIAEAFGINVDTDRVTRAQAMSIPAVRRGRNVIAGTLGSAPLVCVRSRAGGPPERITRQLTTQPDPNVALVHTLTHTVEDLILYPVSFWRILERGPDKLPSRAERIQPWRITINNETQKVEIDGVEAKDRDLIRFDGPDEGLLETGARALRTYLMLEEAVRRFSRMDIPLGFFEDLEGAQTDEEIKTLLDSWEAARIARTTGYIPKGLKYHTPQFNPEQLQLSEARGLQAQEIARGMNLPPHIVNAPTSDSLTYSTTESNRRELVDLTLAQFIAPIEQRLSMPDVTPADTVVRFDLGKFLRGDLSQVIKDGSAAVKDGLMTKDEVRTLWLDLPPLNEEAPSAAQEDRA